jgi:hypothetical protein
MHADKKREINNDVDAPLASNLQKIIDKRKLLGVEMMIRG